MSDGNDAAGNDAAGKDDEGGGLAGLSGLLVGHGALERTLVRVAEFAVAAIPGAEGAGLTLLETGRPQTVVASADFVRAVDDVQYSLNEGPCVSAVADRHPVISGDLGNGPQWPRFGERVRAMGVHSALSLPLLLPGPAGAIRVLGALNVYARPRDTFDERAMSLGVAFSSPAAVSVANAQMLAQAERLVDELRSALTDRAEVDQALGVLMSRTGSTAADAYAQLSALGRSRSLPLGDVARQLLADATARARARRRDTGTGTGEGPRT